MAKSTSPYYSEYPPTMVKSLGWQLGELGWRYESKAMYRGGIGWIELHCEYANLILLPISSSILLPILSSILLPTQLLISLTTLLSYIDTAQLIPNVLGNATANVTVPNVANVGMNIQRHGGTQDPLELYVQNEIGVWLWMSVGGISLTRSGCNPSECLLPLIIS